MFNYVYTWLVFKSCFIFFIMFQWIWNLSILTFIRFFYLSTAWIQLATNNFDTFSGSGLFLDLARFSVCFCGLLLDYFAVFLLFFIAFSSTSAAYFTHSIHFHHFLPFAWLHFSQTSRILHFRAPSEATTLQRTFLIEAWIERPDVRQGGQLLLLISGFLFCSPRWPAKSSAAQVRSFAQWKVGARGSGRHSPFDAHLITVEH